MNRKSNLLLLLCMLMRVAIVQAAESPELVTLRAAHEQQMESAKTPIFTSYLGKLEVLRQQFTRSNKLDAATAVDNEIKRTKRESPNATTTAADPPELIERRAEQARTVSRVEIQPLTEYLRALESLRQQFTRGGKLDAVLSLDAELKKAKDKLTAAQAAASLTTAAPAQIQIVSVIYGEQKAKRTADATAEVRKAFESGAGTFTINGRNLKTGDPAPGKVKSAIFTYTINGKQRQKTFIEGLVVDFKKDLR